MKHVLIFTVVAVSIICPERIFAQEAAHAHRHTEHEHTEYAPIGVMGDHIHESGEAMLSYRYMSMSMDGNRDGTRRLSEQDVFSEGFMVAPTSMFMEMHMIGAMYAPTDDFTIMGMLPYRRISMDHVTMGGARFTTKSEGLGDIRLTGLHVLSRWHHQQLHLNAGISFPTGSIDEKDDTPTGPNQKLPYPMQLGSGTFDLLPGITYLGQSEDWSWGAQLAGTFRLGRNSANYSLGDRGALTGWGARKWTDWLSTSLRIDAQVGGNIDGQDDDLNPAMVPTADPDRRGGERLDFLAGVSILGSEGWMRGHRIAVEFGVPAYQQLDGPQLETDLLFTVAWQLVF